MEQTWPLAVPDWQLSAGRRLRFCLVLSLFVVAAAISFMRFPVPIGLQPLHELAVALIEQRREVPQPQTEPVQMPAPAPGAVTPPREAPAESAPVVEPPERADWRALRDLAVAEVLQESRRTYSLRSESDEQRRVAAVKFRSSQAPVKKEIWENVEKDQFGRTLLWHKGCYRVLDDPSAVNRDIFEMFTQYMVFCVNAEEEWLIEFNHIDDRYAYLAEVPPR